MIIRAEQMDVFRSAAEENFEQRLIRHLRENYADSVVRLPETESPLSELSEETLHSLVKVSIERARSYGLSFESSISAFSALMFEAAPNFDAHNLSSLCLHDENIAPNERIDEILNLLTEEHWERIRKDYDARAWQPNAERAETAEETGKGENQAEKTANPDFAETVINAEMSERAKTPAIVKNPDFDQTVMNIEKQNKPESSGNFDFLNTVLNIDRTEGKK